ncbi:MAG: cytochrome c biogenesis protein ResB [Deltaproteobacteria bacterium]|nr:cytochrome c biogenesis protein ResB [Deltaproteobacteria bacterium]
MKKKKNKKKNKSRKSGNKIWKFFVSVKLTVVVLLTLAATSVIGTFVPQNASPGAYINTFGEIPCRIFSFLDIFDMYHSWWFCFLLLLLGINILICSIDKLSSVWKIIFIKNPKFNLSRYKKLSSKKDFVVQQTSSALRESYQKFVSKNFKYIKINDLENGFYIFAEKGRWTRLGVYCVHLSILLLLLGGLIGSIFGFEGRVNITEGETAQNIRLTPTGAKHKLDFAIKCDFFKVNFYDSGAPKEYRSGLTLIEDGKPVLQKEIKVNTPLRYKGINIFQSSYGSSPPKYAALNFVSSKTGLMYHEKTFFEKETNLPEGAGRLIVKKFTRSSSFMGHKLGEAFLATLLFDNKEPVEITLPVRFPSFDRMRKGALIISADSPPYYTGLQVTYDPGVWIVYTGFILIIIGCWITFFMSHQSLCIEVTQKGAKSSVMIAVTANKNRFGMNNKINNLARKLQLIKSPKENKEIQ